MRCMTHIAASNAITLLILNPTTNKELLLTMGASTIGGIISDLDIRTSDAHKFIDTVTILTFLSMIGLYIYDLNSKTSIFSAIKNGPFFLPIIGILLILLLIFYGSHKPHRSFLHSFLGTLLFTTIFYFCFGNIWLPFLIGILSHIVLDLLNKKGVRLFYPLKKGYSLKLCEYGGLTDKIILFLSIVIIALRLFAF